MNLLACSAFIAFSAAQANCLSLGEINSSQLVSLRIRTDGSILLLVWISKVGLFQCILLPVCGLLSTRIVMATL